MKKVSLLAAMRSLAPDRRVTPPETSRIRTHTGRLRRAGVVAALCLAIAAAASANPPAGGSYSLPRQVVAAGGVASSGGSYRLVGSVGQSVTGPTAAGATQVQQGFHAGQAGPDELFNNGFE